MKTKLKKTKEVNRNETPKANLTFKEMEELTEEIRKIVIGDKGVTMLEYKAAAHQVTSHELGRRKTMALHFELKIESYFPDEVMAILKSKILECYFHRFNKDDNIFLKNNLMKGADWLATRFYTSKDILWRHVKTLGMQIKTQRHIYTKKEDTFIRKNAHKDTSFLAKTLNVSRKSIRDRVARLKIKLRIKLKKNE